ncbi:MAG: nitrate ABC transporter ATP-binding protein [Candidatus Methanomethylicota archaeon]|uniref:Nitrate ABC transporter ATP-binding protein n=1 Tax=Thermoproteota archaeon TaxID=2056631 RepID=A0A523B9G8_9CREN|nr:MAG: nitrate ABC transporter ATP-binding protein [Candidatus Verstraetearchaeota archaeon]
MDKAILLESVSKKYDVGSSSLKVIEDLTFDVNKNEFVCVVGPSGCGKTTLLRIVAGLEPPSSGRVLVFGRPPDPKIQRFGVIFQEDSLLPWRTVLGNVEFGLEIQNYQEAERERVAKTFLELVGLQGFENYYPHQISGGMKKRVAIARALAIDPDLILMDEPFADLDAQTRSLMQRELLKIWSKLNKTVLFITHNVEEAVFLAQRVVVLTKRPSRVKQIIDIDLPYPRARLSPPFISYRERILTAFHEELEGI